jgi:hypothetical protein
MDDILDYCLHSKAIDACLFVPKTKYIYIRIYMKIKAQRSSDCFEMLLVLLQSSPLLLHYFTTHHRVHGLVLLVNRNNTIRWKPFLGSTMSDILRRNSCATIHWLEWPLWLDVFSTTNSCATIHLLKWPLWQSV